MILHWNQARRCVFTVLLLGVVCATFSQNHQTRDNHTGLWASANSWDPSWTNPDTLISNASVAVYGYLTSLTSLTFQGNSQALVIYDTLVVLGDLNLGSNITLRVEDAGILIVRGDLVIDNQTVISANGYFIVAGDISKSSSVNQGSFISNDNPTLVFITGSIFSTGITSDNANYPVINQVNPELTVYPGSHFPYGNLEDLANDPVFGFFKSTCPESPDIPVVSTSDPVSFCMGDSVMLQAGIHHRYYWSNGDTTASPWVGESGSYSVQVANHFGCLSAPSVPLVVTVIPTPEVSITSSGGPLCLSDSRLLTGMPEGGIFSLVDGSGTIQGDLLTPLATGTVQVTYVFGSGCIGKDSQVFAVQPNPVAVGGTDQELFFETETRMQAELTEAQTGEWSLVSGSAIIGDPSSPTTVISNLTTGENIFLWTVHSGGCEDGQEVRIFVREILVPSVITPNGDSRNDFFRIDYPGQMKLTLFNQWGNREYSSEPYENNWGGKNDKGDDLPADTYFYLLQFDSGIVKKGFIYIKR